MLVKPVAVTAGTPGRAPEAAVPEQLAARRGEQECIDDRAGVVVERFLDFSFPRPLGMPFATLMGQVAAGLGEESRRRVHLEQQHFLS
jgi:hypothetical protein